MISKFRKPTKLRIMRAKMRAKLLAREAIVVVVVVVVVKLAILLIARSAWTVTIVCRLSIIPKILQRLSHLKIPKKTAFLRRYLISHMMLIPRRVPRKTNLWARISQKMPIPRRLPRIKPIIHKKVPIPRRSVSSRSKLSQKMPIPRRLPRIKP